MNPRQAAEVLCRVLLDREPNAHELAWAERVVRSVLPRGEDATPTETLRGFPATGMIQDILTHTGPLHERHTPERPIRGNPANPERVHNLWKSRKS